MGSVAKAVASVLVAQTIVGAVVFVIFEMNPQGFQLAFYVGFVLGPLFVLVVYTVAIRELIDARIERFAARALQEDALADSYRAGNAAQPEWQAPPETGPELTGIDAPAAAIDLLESNEVVTRRELEETWPAESAGYDSAAAWWEDHLEPELTRHPDIEQLDGTARRWGFDPD